MGSGEHRWPWRGYLRAPVETLAVADLGAWRSAAKRLRADLERHPGAEGEPRWLVYTSYEAGRLFEPAIGWAGSPEATPLVCFWRYEGPAVDLGERPPAPLPRALARALPSAAVHRERIEACRRHIGRGDIYQANLSRRIEMDFPSAPDGLGLCRALQARERHSYASWLRLAPGVELLSLTMECLLAGRFGERAISSFPIKGTAGPGDESLLGDPKERAEHVMIVDLVRNDLGRVAEIGSVEVDPLLGARDLRTLRHMESGVRARLLPGLDPLHALEALLPGGSITGAPKIRATRIIAEIEGRPRGPYTGALMAVDAAGRTATSLLIRTLVLRGRRAHLDVGGGIVWGSDPEREIDETRRKALAHLEGVVSEIP